MNVTNEFVETINCFFEKFRQSYPQAAKLHVCWINLATTVANSSKRGALLQGIELHYLPPYSPNLNPIERLWTVMNEQVRHNVVFHSAQAFHEQLTLFFTATIPKIKNSLATRINDNFQTFNTVSSS